MGVGSLSSPEAYDDLFGFCGVTLPNYGQYTTELEVVIGSFLIFRIETLVVSSANFTMELEE